MVHALLSMPATATSSGTLIFLESVDDVDGHHVVDGIDRVRMVHKIPDSVSYEQGALVSRWPLPCMRFGALLKEKNQVKILVSAQ